MINSIFIKFGDKCNLHCKYCFQEKKNVSYEYNKDFIINLSKKYSSNVKFILIGGEPLIWRDEIIKTVLILREDNHPITVITNGSLLDKEIIDFFNEHHIKVTISWDGNYSLIDRGYNAIDNKLLTSINNLNFSSLITNNSFLKDKFLSFDELNKKRFDTGFNPVSFNIKLAYGLIYTNDSLLKIRKESLSLGTLSDISFSSKYYLNKIKSLYFSNKDITYSCEANVTQLTYTCSGKRLRCISSSDTSNDTFINKIKNDCMSCTIFKFCSLPCYYKTLDINNFCSAQKALYAFL